MDRYQDGVTVVEGTKESFSQVQLRELNDLQLVLVGGGMGDTIL